MGTSLCVQDLNKNSHQTLSTEMGLGMRLCTKWMTTMSRWVFIHCGLDSNRLVSWSLFSSHYFLMLFDMILMLLIFYHLVSSFALPTCSRQLLNYDWARGTPSSWIVHINSECIYVEFMQTVDFIGLKLQRKAYSSWIRNIHKWMSTGWNGDEGSKRLFSNVRINGRAMQFNAYGIIGNDAIPVVWIWRKPEEINRIWRNHTDAKVHYRWPRTCERSTMFMYFSSHLQPTYACNLLASGIWNVRGVLYGPNAVVSAATDTLYM